MLEIGPLQRDDLSAALRLSTQAGWNQVEQDWARLIDLDSDCCLAGRLDGRVVATATLVRYEPRWAWVGMVLVDAGRRGRGFGGQVMDAILRRAAELGIESLGLDATDAGRPIYAKRGFVDLIGIDRRVLLAAKRDVGDLSGEALREKDWADVLRLDRSATGVDRSGLLTRMRDDSLCRVMRSAGRVTAFAFMRAGRFADHIGPVVAVTPGEAQSLILSLGGQSNRDLILDTLRGGALERWFDSIEFAVVRKLTRMVSGPVNGGTLADGRIIAAAGFELG